METLITSLIETLNDNDLDSKADLTEWDFQSNSENLLPKPSNLEVIPPLQVENENRKPSITTSPSQNTNNSEDAKLMELYIWPGDYGLPSMDPECIRIVLYTLFTSAPIKICNPRNPVWTANDLPILDSQGYKWKTYSECQQQLRFQRYSLDFAQSNKVCSETHAFVTLALRHLSPIYEYVAWIEKTNFEGFTRLWYSKIIPPIFSHYFIHMRRKKAFTVVKAKENLIDEVEMKNHLHRNAKECFDILSTRLGQDKYFNGQSPSTLDCVVYAYLAPLIKVPFPADDIPRMLKGHDRLVQYVKRIDETYQQDMLNNIARILPSLPDTQNVLSSSFSLKVFSTIFVACAMIGYAFSNQISIHSKK